MKRSLLSFAALALAAMAGSAAAAGVPGRHILLSDDGQTGSPPGTVRFLSQRIELADGQTQSWITLTRTGNFSDPRYGDFMITPTHLQQMVENFDKRTLGQDVFIDVAHKPNDGAAAKVLKLTVENGRLRALVAWTEFGLKAVKERGFAYLSAEYHENWRDNEAKNAHGCVLLGAGLTTRPVIKNLDPVQLSEGDEGRDAFRLAVSTQLINELSSELTNMNYLEQLKAKLLALGLTGDALTKLLAEAKLQLDAAGTDQVKALAVVAAWETTGKVLADQVKALAAAGNTAPVTITLAQPGAPVDVAGEVARLLSERETAAATAASTLAAKLKLLGDTIAEGDKTLTPEGVKKLCDAVAPLVSAGTSDEQVKALAELQLNNVRQLSAAHKLVSLGYAPASGSVHITVDESNQVKALQEQVDRRLGFDRMSPARRFDRTRGVLLAENQAFAEQALAAFDSDPVNARRLAEEHRALAGGTGSISDAAVPVIVERTVLRESLYRLTSLNFMNVGTAPFANVINVPYSYRDTTAAGVDALRIYEGQGIRDAGVIQTQEEARPIPQKLAFKLSSELQLLLGAAAIDFDPVAENVRNLVRIVGEDTEAMNCNELVHSADESGALPFTNTLTAQCNGTNRVFVTTNWPVVKPRKVYDLKGAQVGATLNDLVVTLGGTARSPFVRNADGSALAAGIYYLMDWNLGELRFVDQTGASHLPANGTTLTVAGFYATNVVKWDSDAVAGEDVDARYDRLLTVIGGRKAVLDSDRFYNPDMVLMSATLDNAISQAKSFQANASRVATGLAADGSVGQIKALSTYNTTAPGLVMGDTRILVGERGNSRFRMVKPWTMNPLEQVRNSNGQFTDQRQSFGTQFVMVHTPTQLKNSLSSVVVYSATARVARA